MSDTEADDIAATPIGFAETILGLSLYVWQDTVLTWFENTKGRTKGALCTPNGAGKSERVVASLALWWLAVHKRGKVVVTTKDSRQLDNQVYPAMAKHREKLGGWRFIDRYIETPTGGSCVFFTTDEAGRAEGWHKEGDIDGPLLIIVDEGKSVPEPIFQAFDRCTYNAILYVSSPGVKSGRFYESCTQDKGFRTLQVGLADCPHIPKERIDDIVRTYGEDHPFTLSTLHGEFMDEDGDSMFIIPPSVVRMLYENPPAFSDGEQYAFCDFAAGGDENVLAHRIGNRVQPLVTWKDTNTMAALGRFIMEFTRRKLKPHQIYGDESGLGGPMCDRLSESGWPINRVNNGGKPQDDRYENRGAEMWHTAGLRMQQFDCILPDDPKLKAQLTTRKLKPLSDGSIGVESKKDMKKRGISSPDRADAVVGVLAVESEHASSEFDQTGIAKIQAQVIAAKPKHGALATSAIGLVFTEDSHGWLTVWEEPTYGRSYIASLKDGPDNWSVMVLRAPCKDSDGKLLPTRLAARIRLPCQWDGARLIDCVVPLLKHYGNPVIVPEARNTDALMRLRKAGCSVLRRPVFDKTAGGKTEFTYGWETNSKSADAAIGALSQDVREQQIVIECQDALRDMRGFERKTAADNGDTMTIGMALASIGAAHQLQSPSMDWYPDHRSAGEASDLGGACS